MSSGKIMASTSMTPGLWFLRPRPRDGARFRLFCFPYAGGSPNLFRGWADRLPETMELFAVRLPGRDLRIRERPFTDWPTLLAACRQACLPYLDRPYALFGHSFGASVAFMLAHDLQRCDRPHLERLFVSACRPPHVPSGRPDMHRLPKKLFLARFAALNGTPPEVLSNAAFVDVVEPMLRADMQLAETRPRPPSEPLSIPISVFSGREDAIAPPRFMQEWDRYTRSDCSVHAFAGDHFFIHQEAAVLQTIADLSVGLLQK